MIEVKIPKEINKYEAKFIGPFTMRQSVALGIALPTCVIMYNVLSQYLAREAVVFALLFPAGFAALFGWVKPYGMKFEEFMRSVFISAFVAPSKRKYVTENYYTQLKKEIMKAEREEELAKSGSKKQKKKKYKPSKEAIK